MAYRELFVVEIREVLRLWRRGQGYRTVSRRTAVDRKTVRRYVEAARALGLERDGGRPLDDGLIAEVVAVVRPGAPSAAGAMRQHCRVHRKLIEGWLDDGCKGPKVVRLLGRHTGVVVPLRTLQRFVAEELGRDGRPGDTVRIADPPAGQVLEVDFLQLGHIVQRGAGTKLMMHALLCTAGYSRHQFVWPCTTQTQEDVIEGLDAAWRFFGGVFHVVVSDNLKAIVEVPDPVSPKLNPTFVEYMQARDFLVDAARVRKPKDKARVERQVQFVRNDYFAGEDFGDLDEARREAVRWCRDEAGMRTHGTTRRHPREVFEQEEQSLLGPAPDAPYDSPRWSTVHVGRDHAVVVDYVLYSVPHVVSEGELRVRRDRATVKLYRGAALVKVHARKQPGEPGIDPADLPPGKVALATRSGESLQQIAEGVGPNVSEYTRRLLEGPLPWTRMRRVYRLLGLAKRHGRELVDEACARALELDVVDVTRIDRMLERGLVRRGLLLPPTPPPKPTRSNVIPMRFARDPGEFRIPMSSSGDEPNAPA